MKNTKLILVAIILIASYCANAQVAVNKDGSAASSSAMLDIKATDGGLLIPRMTATERDNIASPATGLMVYVTTDNNFYWYNGTAWVTSSGSDGHWTVSGNNMYSDVSGNLGIGTSNPVKKLTVAGNAQVQSDGAWAPGATARLYLGPDNNMWIEHIHSGGLNLETAVGWPTNFSNAGNVKMSILPSGNVGIGTATPGAQLDVNGEINYVSGSITARVHNAASNTIKTTGLVYFGTSWADVDATNYTVSLPTAGTYLIYGTLRGIHWGNVSAYGKVRLFNVTTSSQVTNSDRMFFESTSSSQGHLNLMVTPIWTITVNAASTIRLQGLATVASTVGIQCDINGYNEFGYVRLY
jgi:hypothetical protein